MLSVLDDNDDIAIDTAQLIAHTLVQANSGGGKTVACRRILEQTFGVMPQWIIDPEGEMHTLRERFPHLLAAPHGGDTVASVKTAPMLCRRLLETGASCVIDIYDLSVDERHAFVKAFAEAAMNQPRTLWRDVLVVIDEAHRYCPERGEDPSDAAGAVKNWLTAGRKRGYAMILAVQRLSTLHKSAAAECNNRLIGRTGLDTDQDRAGKALGLRRPEDREALARLKPGRFWVYGPAFCERPTEIQIGAIRTSHGRAARGKAATPPLDEARKYLAQIGDLPAEAEAELKTMEQLKARVAELDKDLREARGEISRMTTRPADEVIRASREYDAKLDKMQAERDEAQRAVKRLQDRLLAISPIVADHANKLGALKDELLAQLERPEKELGVVLTGTIEKPQTFTGGIGTTADGKPHPTYGFKIIEDSTEVPATSRINGPVGPPAALARRSTATTPMSERMPAMQRAFLTVLAQRDTLPKAKVLLFAGYADSGSTSACWTALTALGYVTSNNGTVSITKSGLTALGPYETLPTGRALLAQVLEKLPRMERTLLQVVADQYPREIAKGKALALAGYSDSGSTSAAWTYLTSRDYIHTNRGNVTAAKELCVP